jgi:hypothetical protein
MVKVGSRNIVLVLLFALLVSSCEKEPILTIKNRVEVTPVQKKSNVNKKKHKIKLFKIFRKKQYEKN